MKLPFTCNNRFIFWVICNPKHSIYSARSYFANYFTEGPKWKLGDEDMWSRVFWALFADVQCSPWMNLNSHWEKILPHICLHKNPQAQQHCYVDAEAGQGDPPEQSQCFIFWGCWRPTGIQPSLDFPCGGDFGDLKKLLSSWVAALGVGLSISAC